MTIDSAAVVKLLQSAAAPAENGAAGMAFQAVDREGKVIAAGVSGYRDLENKIPVELNTVFWIASCTKMITSIALMQLVERGEVDLDDAEAVKRVLPEIAAAKVLKDGREEEQSAEKGAKSITLRMLLTHTAGLSYTFLWEEYWNAIGDDPSKDEFSGREKAFHQPLKYQPGTDREYAIGIDWCGIFIERHTKIKLGEYMEKNIFKPLGMTTTAFVPTSDMRSRMTRMHTRDDSGKVIPRKHPLYHVFEEPEVPEDYFHSGGGGLLSTVQDYTKVIAAMMNDGVSHTTLNRILMKGTIDQMFTNQISDYHEKYGTKGMAVSRKDLISAIFEGEQPDMGPVGWGLSFLLMGEKLQMANAPGICNCFWVMDRTSGKGGILLSQMLPLGDQAVMGVWMQLVGTLYAP